MPKLKTSSRTKAQKARARKTRKLMVLLDRVSNINALIKHDEEIVKGEMFNVQKLKESYLKEIKKLRIDLVNLDKYIDKK